MTLRQKHVLGRDAEVEVVEQLVGALPEHGGALVVVGEAGIGKSALLGVARACAVRKTASPCSRRAVCSRKRTLLSRGSTSRRGLGSESSNGLPVRQRDAVEAAFGLGDWAAPDTFFVALAALDLLAEMAAKRPAPPARRGCALARHRDVRRPRVRGPASGARAPRRRHHRAGRFRRAPDTRRPPDAEAHGARRGRGGGPARRKCARPGPGAPAARSERRSGQPARARGAPPGARRGQLRGPLSAGAAAADRAARACVRLIRFGAPDCASAPLLVAALDQEGDLSHVLEAASALAGRRVDLGDLAPVVDAGLASVDESGIRFRHPLIRSAIYQHASLADRQASHTALAAAYEDDPDRSVWHRAAALVAPDDSVVDELEEAAARARRRGVPSAAAVALRRAAQLTNHTPRLAALLIGAAELEHEIGHHDIALRTVQEARWLDLDHPTRLRVAFLLETLESRWSGTEMASAFVDLAEELGDAGEADQALRALATVAMRCWWGNPEQTTRERSGRRRRASRDARARAAGTRRSRARGSDQSGTPRARAPRAPGSRRARRPAGDVHARNRSHERVGTQPRAPVPRSGCRRLSRAGLPWAARAGTRVVGMGGGACRGRARCDSRGGRGGAPRRRDRAAAVGCGGAARPGYDGRRARGSGGGRGAHRSSRARVAADGRESDAPACAVRAWARRDRASSTHRRVRAPQPGSTTLPTSRSIRSSVAGRPATSSTPLHVVAASSPSPETCWGTTSG